MRHQTDEDINGLLTLNSLPGVQNREIVAQMMAKVPFF